MADVWSPVMEGQIVHADRRRRFPATSAQQGIWFTESLGIAPGSYLVPTVIDIHGAVSVENLRNAVRFVLGRHPALQSRFLLADDGRSLHWESIDVEGGVDVVPGYPGVSEADREAEMRSWAAQPFDLSRGPLARARIMGASPRVLLAVVTHHIVCDGASRALLVDQIGATYRALELGQDPMLPTAENPDRFVEHADALRIQERAVELRGAPLDLPLPYARPRQSSSMAGTRLRRPLPTTHARHLRDLARSLGATPFMIGLALLAGAFAVRSPQRTFLFACGWPGRESEESRHAVGMLMETMILRMDLPEGDLSTETLLLAARRAAREGMSCADVPFDALARLVDPDRDIRSIPVARASVNAVGEVPELQLGNGVRTRLVGEDDVVCKWDLSLFVDAVGEQDLVLDVYFVEALFDECEISALLDDAVSLAADPDKQLEPENRSRMMTMPENEMGSIAAVRTIWKELLGRVIDDIDLGFFEAGGNSLLLISLTERLNAASGEDLDAIDLFDAGTIRRQAALLGERSRA